MTSQTPSERSATSVVHKSPDETVDGNSSELEDENGVEEEEETLPWPSSESPGFTKPGALAQRNVSRSCPIPTADVRVTDVQQSSMTRCWSRCHQDADCKCGKDETAPFTPPATKQGMQLLKSPETPESDFADLPEALRAARQLWISHWSAALEPPVPVRLHVYDLSAVTRMLNLPLFHLGVEVYQREHSFTSRGVISTRPGDNKAYRHREVVTLGHTDLTGRQVYNLLTKVKRSWAGSSYDLLSRNCVTFSVAFCRLLGIKRPIPAEYSRFAAVNCASCAVPHREEPAVVTEGASDFGYSPAPLSTRMAHLCSVRRAPKDEFQDLGLREFQDFDLQETSNLWDPDGLFPTAKSDPMPLGRRVVRKV